MKDARIRFTTEMHVWVHSIEKVSTSVSTRMGPAQVVVSARDKCGGWVAVEEGYQGGGMGNQEKAGKV